MTIDTVTLARPGAGLPPVEAWIARRVIFPLKLRTTSWAASNREFQAEGQRVLSIFDALPPEQLNRPVLIARLTGMEDSSRNWSATMVLEHLNIVGNAIRTTIAGLRQGKSDLPAARTDAVKPRGTIAPQQARAQFVDLLANAAADSAPPLARGVGPTSTHPWFGPLDVFGWHCLLGMHQQVHRKQLEAVRRVIAETKNKFRQEIALPINSP